MAVDEVSFADARRRLLKTYWSPQGWRQPPDWPEEQEFADAVEAGIMFDAPRELNHDEWVVAAVDAASGVDPREAEMAFLASLSSRRLDLRSALGSYAVARNLPTHTFTTPVEGRQCSVCGLPQRPGEVDLNVLNFERHKWGGVRRDDVTYIAFDLEQFAATRLVESTAADRDIANLLFSMLRNADPDTTAPKIASDLTMIKGNRDERRSLLGTLGVCGILQSGEHPGYRESFIPYAERELPNRHFVDDPYPVCWWKGADGVDQAALAEFLPNIAR